MELGLTMPKEEPASGKSGAGPATTSIRPDLPPRERLILAASMLFAERGFGGVSVREICKAAGTGINMIHHYFGNKEGLLEEIVRQFDVRVYAVPLRLLEKPARSRDDLTARMELLFETTLEACLAERDLLMVVLREQAALETLNAFQDGLVSFLEAAKDQGLVRDGLDAPMISGAMLDRIVSQVQFAPWIMRASGVDIANDADYRQRWCRSNVDLFLHGILADDARA